LADLDAESVWGWSTPAGKIRADRRAQMISSGAGLEPGSLVLEIGCGTGLFTEKFARTGSRLIAVDISGDLLQKAIERGLPRPQVRFIEGRFEDSDMDGPFAAVIGSSVLHHLDIELACRRIWELLQPGGWMCFTEPNMLNPQIFLERRFRRFFPQVSPDETAFVRWVIRRLLIRIGFDRVTITPFDWLHPATPSRLIGLMTKTGRILESIPILQEFAGSLFIRARKPD